MNAVTVLVPAHNEEATIGQTITSALKQADRVLVVADNCTDGTVTAARAAGAEVIETVGNTDKKAGALNHGMPFVDSEFVLVMDADTELGESFVEVALDRLTDPSIGAVGGTFFARSETNMLQRMQANEYARYMREIARRKGARANVLTGAGSMFRASVLTQVRVARSTGTLPGTGYYRQDALTEDNELSFCIQRLGYRIVSPKACAIWTDCPDNLRDLFAQRLRWRRGAMEDIKAHGLNAVTARYLGKMLWAFFVSLLFIAYLYLLSTVDNYGLSVFWATVLIIGVVDKVWTIRGRGLRNAAMAAAVLPEIAYDLFQQVVLFVAGWKFLTRAPQVW